MANIEKKKAQPYGVIDGIRQYPNFVMLHGWVYFLCDTIKCEVSQFSVVNFNPYTVTVIPFSREFRGDLTNIEDKFVGFRIRLENYTAEDLLRGRIKLIATLNEFTYYLPIWECLYNGIELQTVQEESDALKTIIAKIKEDNEGFSSFYVPVGTMSINNDAVVGKSGQIFLLSGSNNVSSLYSQVNEQHSAEILNVFKSRNLYFHSNGIRYIQTIIPEKQTIHGLLMTPSITKPTNTLVSIQDVLDRDGDVFYINSCQVLSQKSKFEHVYRKCDTHLNIIGVGLIFEALITRLLLPNINQPEKFHHVIGIGDLSERFAIPLNEEILFPISEYWNFGKETPELLYSFSPADNSHIGICRHWRNLNYVSDKRILIFGGSTCSIGHTPLHLSWWIARYFKETYFLWSSNVDTEIVNQFKPDIVFCQTIERFLTQIPKF